MAASAPPSDPMPNLDQFTAVDDAPQTIPQAVEDISKAKAAVDTIRHAQHVVDTLAIKPNPDTLNSKMFGLFGGLLFKQKHDKYVISLGRFFLLVVFVHCMVFFARSKPVSEEEMDMFYCLLGYVLGSKFVTTAKDLVGALSVRRRKREE